MNYDELVAKINIIRRSRDIVTNAFFTAQQLKSMFELRNVFVSMTDDVVIILAEEEKLIRLYFYAVSLEALKQIPDLLLDFKSKPIIAEIIGKGVQVEKVIAKLQKYNFNRHNQLIRMNRLAQECHVNDKDVSSVKFATKDRVDEIRDILYREFDIYTSHLPTLEKIEKAVENQEITLVIYQEKIAGLAYFEKLGEKLNYLYQIVVDEKFRGQSIADILLLHKFISSKDTVFQLWVEVNNQRAINKYIKYNFIPDGLVDYIMIYKGE